MFALETGTPSTQHGTDKEKNKPASRQRRVRRPPLIPAPSVSGALSPIGPLKPESKFLLDHYLHRTGKMASAHVGHYTPFTDALLPIAHNSSPVLLDSILAFSSFHLRTSGSNFSSVNTLEHHALALRSLKYGLTRYSRGDKEMGIQLFLSMLMLCCVEVGAASLTFCQLINLDVANLNLPQARQWPMRKLLPSPDRPSKPSS